MIRIGFEMGWAWGKRRDKAVAILATLLGKEAAAAFVPDRHRERGGPNVKSCNGQTLGPVGL
jgi:hypothetical protein